MKEQILIGGIGNIFLGDDAFGVEVVRRLAKLPDAVRVVDFGIRGFDLMYALMDGYETTILVDAMPRGGTPGSVYVIEPDLRNAEPPAHASFDAHSLDPVKVLALAKAMGGKSNRVIVVGCEPGALGEEEGGRMGLSPAVDAAATEAAKMIEALVTNLLKIEPSKTEVAEIARSA